MLRTTADTPAPGFTGPDRVRLRHPTVEDGAAMWRIARDSRVLDLNPSYAYLLWCRDFAATSVVATVDEQPAGFVTGYRRPDQPETLMVWQVAVVEQQRGNGLAGRMLSELVDAVEDWASSLETTVAPGNVASIRLFSALARSRGAELVREPIFDGSLFPDEHEPEQLFRIGPLS